MRGMVMSVMDSFIRQAVESCIHRSPDEPRKEFIARRYRARRKLAHAVNDRMWSCGRPICPQARALLVKYDVLVMGD